jgi:membrane protein implicated in regulation of membrane protease activity
MMTFYFICLLVGIIFAILSFIFSGGYEASVDAGVDLGADVDVGADFGHDISGHDVGIGEVHFPLFSPIVIACFVTAFGGGGIIGLELFPFMAILSLPIALGTGLMVGLLAGLLVMKIYKSASANQVTSVKDIAGSIAEVTEAIPAEGVGSISFAGKGCSISGPARGEEKKDIKRHAMVTITRVVGGLYYVREHVDEKLRDVNTESAE